MNKRTVWINIGAGAVVLAVLGWLGYLGMSRVHSVDILAIPKTLPPDGRSEAQVQVHFTNIFGLEAWTARSVRFEIAEGRECGTIVSTAARSVRIRSAFLPGRIVLHISIQGNPLPYEITIPVRPNYAIK